MESYVLMYVKENVFKNLKETRGSTLQVYAQVKLQVRRVLYWDCLL